MPLYEFSPEEMAALREVVALVRSGRLGTQSVPRFIDDVTQTPDVYVALSPAAGVPGRLETATGTGSADVPTAGSAVCDIYRIANTHAGASGTNEIVAIDNLSHTVYNLSETDIPPSRWFPVARLKTGGWVALGTGGTAEGEPGEPGESLTGDGYCDLAALRPGDGVLIRTTDQGAYKLQYNGAGHWVSAEEFNYTGGSGTFDFFFDTGRLRLKLDGLDLLSCGDGCFAGGALTGHTNELGSGTGVGMTGTGTGFAECEGDFFRVCVECTCGQPAGWYCANFGAGCVPVYLDEDDVCDPDLHNKICSGPYASYALASIACPAPVQGTISTGCCPVDLLTTTKYLEIVAVGFGGPAECAGQVVTLTHIGEGTTTCDGALNGIRWRGTLVCGGFTTVYTLMCVTTVGVEQNTWKLCEDCTVGGGGFEWMTPNYIGSPANSCNPFSQAFNSATWADCYGAGTKYLITDTP